MADLDLHVEVWVGSSGPYIIREGDEYPGEPGVQVMPFRIRIVDTDAEWALDVDHASNALILEMALSQVGDVESSPQDGELLVWDDTSEEWVGNSLADLDLLVQVGSVITGHIVEFGSAGTVVDSGLVADDILVRSGALVNGNLVEADGDENLVDSGEAVGNLARRASGHTTDNVAKLDADGDPADAGFAVEDAVRHVSGAGKVQHGLLRIASGGTSTVYTTGYSQREVLHQESAATSGTPTTTHTIRVKTLDYGEVDIPCTPVP